MKRSTGFLYKLILITYLYSRLLTNNGIPAQSNHFYAQFQALRYALHKKRLNYFMACRLNTRGRGVLL